MASISKAAIQSFRLEAASFIDIRNDDTLRGYDTKTASEQRIADATCADFKRWFAKSCDDASTVMMMRADLDANFINTPKISGKYNVKKVFELAPYLANVSGKLDTYDLVVFRTLYNFALKGLACTAEHLMAAIDHMPTATHSELVFRMKGEQKGVTTSKVQYLSSVTSFRVWNMVKPQTCRDTGKQVFALNLEAFATKAMIARLGLGGVA